MQTALSVSSVGSWALQRLPASCGRLPPLPFSILGRIVGTATIARSRMPAASAPFSILGRIVGTATTRQSRPPTCAASLSVSSVGSWALQLAAVLLTTVASPSFSILGRIVGTATELSTRSSRQC